MSDRAELDRRYKCLFEGRMIRITAAIILVSQAEGHADAPILLALPHEPHVLAVGLVDEEVHVQVGEIHFRY